MDCESEYFGIPTEGGATNQKDKKQRQAGKRGAQILVGRRGGRDKLLSTKKVEKPVGWYVHKSLERKNLGQRDEINRAKKQKRDFWKLEPENKTKGRGEKAQNHNKRRRGKTTRGFCGKG